MSELKTIRDLVGDYYSSLADLKNDLQQRQVGKSFVIHLPVKEGFNPLPKKVEAAFYQSIAHLSVVDSKYQHFYFDKYDTSNRFFLFSPGDKIEVCYVTVSGRHVGNSIFSISTNNLAKVSSLPKDYKMKPFLIKILSKSSIVEPNYQQQADKYFASLKRTLGQLLKEADNAKKSKRRKIRLGKTNNGDVSRNVLNFFTSLKISLDPKATLSQWEKQLDHSQINWGFKDLEDIKCLSALLNAYENQADIMQGKVGLSTLFNRVKAQAENTTHDYETMLQLLKELSHS